MTSPPLCAPSDTAPASTTRLPTRASVHIVGGELVCAVDAARWAWRGTLPGDQSRRFRASPRRHQGCSPHRPHRRAVYSVDSPDGLYLVGGTDIATHNSELASIHFPTGAGQPTDHQRRYNLRLPIGFSRKVRGSCATHYKAIFPDSQLDPDSPVRGSVDDDPCGGFTAAGVGGGITGKVVFAPVLVYIPRNGIPPSRTSGLETMY